MVGDRMPSSSTTPGIPDVLNSSGCRIGYSEGKGKGVFASRRIPASTTIDISPVLLFGEQEYAEHGKYTLLDHYTFRWPDRRMALALGLGSLFNHSEAPNVNYICDTATQSIVYTTTRAIQPDEELCIFYGYNLWFQPEGSSSLNMMFREVPEEDPDGWGGLTAINPFFDGKQDEVLTEDDLPFIRVKVMPDNEEEDGSDTFPTMLAWVVDVPDSRAITSLLKWTKEANMETPDLHHLKRIRRAEGRTSLILCNASDLPRPVTSPEFALPMPYTVRVPATAALTLTTLRSKTAIWPTVYAPRRKYESEPWSRARAAWAWDAVAVLREEARKASEEGELPIVSYVPAPFAVEGEAEAAGNEPAPRFIARDTRRSAAHPLRHSVLNVIRQVADCRASAATTPSFQAAPDVTTVPHQSSSLPDDAAAPRNGMYYLTALTLFTTHEPCIMCSMALLHSRIKEIVYIFPMDETGGCGGSNGRGPCIPRLKGVNHRFGIMRWIESVDEDDGLRIDACIDA